MTPRTSLVLTCALALAGGCAATDSPREDGTPAAPNGPGNPAPTSPAPGDSNPGDGNPGDPGDVDSTTDPATPGEAPPSQPGASPQVPPGEEAIAATPDAPCNEDLQVFNGRVVPDLGVVPAGEPFTSNPEDSGPFAVTATDFEVPIEGGTLDTVGYTITMDSSQQPATAYMPDGADGQLPLVVVLAGFQASYTIYADFSNHFASHGFAVLGLDTRSNLNEASHDTESWEVIQAIDYVLSGNSPMADRIDATKIAVSGHSKGGKLSYFVAAMDDRVDQVIAWDPQNAGGPPCFVTSFLGGDCNGQPVAPNCGALNDTMTPQPEGVLHYMQAASLLLAAPEDGLLTPDSNHNGRHFYRGAPSPAEYVLFDAGHADWPAEADVGRISKAIQLATLLTRFKGMTGLDTYLPGGGYAEGEGKVLEVYTK